MSRTNPSTFSGPMSSYNQHSDLNALCTAVASGKIELVAKLIKDGADVNKRASDGSLPLCTAAFWGFADIVNLLLENNADVNGCNKTTGWSATHCAAFQGHGRVLLFLTKHNPDVTIKDSMGRTAVDFASAQEQIWPFFAMLGCSRTSKDKLIELDVIKKITPVNESSPSNNETMLEGNQPGKVINKFSRPGSSYVLSLKAMSTDSSKVNQKPSAASLYGDVLSEES